MSSAEWERRIQEFEAMRATGQLAWQSSPLNPVLGGPPVPGFARGGYVPPAGTGQASPLWPAPYNSNPFTPSPSYGPARVDHGQSLTNAYGVPAIGDHILMLLRTGRFPNLTDPPRELMVVNIPRNHDWLVILGPDRFTIPDMVMTSSSDAMKCVDSWLERLNDIAPLMDMLMEAGLDTQGRTADGATEAA